MNLAIKISYALRFLGFAFLVFILTNCGLSNRKIGSKASSYCSATGVIAFEESVGSWVGQNCASCHGDQGTQTPRFAVSDSHAGCVAMVEEVEFGAPASSTAVRKSTDSHCGPNCSTDGSALTAMIQQWIEEVGPVADNQGGNTVGDLCKSGAAQAAFANSVYALATQKCITCHSTTQFPTFAVSNLITACTEAELAVNKSDISLSKLIKKASDGHCKANGGQNCDAAVDGPAMQTALQSWVAAAN